MSDISQLFRLVFVVVNSVLVQVMLDGIRSNFFIFTKCMQAFQCRSPASKMVVDFELLSKLRELLELPQEWKIFARVLSTVSLTRGNLEFGEQPTFCAC